MTDGLRGLTVRYTCANWEGDPYYGVHTGPCESEGYVDVPVEHELRDTWRDWLLHNESTLSWTITAHHCGDDDHEVHAGNRYHNNVHEMLFCCGPCMLSYLVCMYDRDPHMQAYVLMKAAGADRLRNAIESSYGDPF